MDWDDFEVERRIMETKLVSYQWRTGQNFRDSIQYEGDFDLEFDQAIHRLKTYVLAEHLATDYYSDTSYFDMPSSTWQMFKMLHNTSWWLSWLVRRWPVRYNKLPHTVGVQVKRYVGYPESHIPIPGLGHPFILEELHQLDPDELMNWEERKQLAEAAEEEKHVVETYLVVDETLDDLAAATGLPREWFENVQAFDQQFGLQSKIYVVPKDIHHEEV